MQGKKGNKAKNNENPPNGLKESKLISFKS